MEIQLIMSILNFRDYLAKCHNKIEIVKRYVWEARSYIVLERHY